MKKKELRKGIVISVVNGKGGVGKTTIIRFLSFILSSMYDMKVLNIDYDPQANLTKTMIVTKDLYSEEEESFEFEKTMMTAIIEDSGLKQLITNCVGNLDFIPSSYDFREFSDYVNWKFGSRVKVLHDDYYDVTENKISVLNELLSDFREEYDIIFVDSPPTSSEYVKNALYASDYVIMAFQTQDDSTDGIFNYIENDIIEIIENYDSDLEILGILPNQLENGAIDKTVYHEMIEKFGEDNVFKNIVKRVKRVQSVSRLGLRVDGYWDRRAIEDVFIPVAEELLERLEFFEGER